MKFFLFTFATCILCFSVFAVGEHAPQAENPTPVRPEKGVSDNEQFANLLKKYSEEKTEPCELPIFMDVEMFGLGFKATEMKDGRLVHGDEQAFLAKKQPQLLNVAKAVDRVLDSGALKNSSIRRIMIAEKTSGPDLHGFMKIGINSSPKEIEAALKGAPTAKEFNQQLNNFWKQVAEFEKKTGILVIPGANSWEGDPNYTMQSSGEGKYMPYTASPATMEKVMQKVLQMVPKEEDPKNYFNPVRIASLTFEFSPSLRAMPFAGELFEKVRDDGYVETEPLILNYPAWFNEKSPEPAFALSIFNEKISGLPQELPKVSAFFGKSDAAKALSKFKQLVALDGELLAKHGIRADYLSRGSFERLSSLESMNSLEKTLRQTIALPPLSKEFRYRGRAVSPDGLRFTWHLDLPVEELNAANFEKLMKAAGTEEQSVEWQRLSREVCEESKGLVSPITFMGGPNPWNGYTGTMEDNLRQTKVMQKLIAAKKFPSKEKMQVVFETHAHTPRVWRSTAGKKYYLHLSPGATEAEITKEFNHSIP